MLDQDDPDPQQVSQESDGQREKLQAEVDLEDLEQRETSFSQVDEDDEDVVYKIRPHLYDKFKTITVKEVIQNVLFDELSTKTYSAEDAVHWSKNIADSIREKVKDLKFKRYKYIVNVVLGEQHGAGVKMGTRCIWDAEADAYAYDSFTNVRKLCDRLGTAA